MPRSDVPPRPARPNVQPARLRLGSLIVVTLCAACVAPVTPNLVITNARVFTNDSTQPWAEAIAIKGERVIAVGESAALRASAGPATRVIDAGGRVLVPGFNDARVDLPLEPPTPAKLAALDQMAIARGVTSLQVVAGGPLRSLVVAAQQAARQARWRLIRSPEDTAPLSTTDPTAMVRQDEEPFLPPQPGLRLTANGVAWQFGECDGRRGLDETRVETVVAWAYGAEDPIIVRGAVGTWLDALGRFGRPEVWKRKRPRFDVGVDMDDRWALPLVQFGAVVAVTPATDLTVRTEARRAWYHLSPFLDGGIVLAAGSGGMPAPMPVLAAMTAAQPPSPGPRARALTREEAVRAMTWGSAYAEKAERDKGWLGSGTLADLAVLSADIFAVPAERLPAITSVLTLVGGTIVYDAGVLPK